MSPILGIWASSRPPLSITGSMEPIAVSTVPSGGLSSITFGSIPQTYTHLQIRYISRNASATDTTIVRFNNDSGSNYAWHQLRGSGSTATSVAGTNASYWELPWVTYSGTTASAYGSGVADILDYTNTNKYKTARAFGGADTNGSGFVYLASGLWQSTSAISTIVIQASTGNLAQYSSYALYGIKGA
jgi:hypothetical protein